MSDQQLEMEYERVRTVLLTAVRKVKPRLPQASLHGDEHLAAELGVDSVDRMEMLIAVEEAFGVQDEVDPRVFMIPQSINELARQMVASERPSA